MEIREALRLHAGIFHVYRERKLTDVEAETANSHMRSCRPLTQGMSPM